MFKRTIKTLIVMLLTISMTMPIANVKAYEENYERNVMPARDYDKFDDNFNVNQSNSLVRSSQIPSTYSSVDEGFVTSIKNQNPYGNCWAYAACSVAESYLIKKGMASSDIDLSEAHLNYYMYHNKGDKYENTDNDQTNVIGKYSFTDVGADPRMLQLAMSNFGLASETSYPISKITTMQGSKEDQNNTQYVMTNSNLLCQQAKGNESIIKQAILDNGSVLACYYDTSTAYKNSNYYNSNEVNSFNHAISIVGWDDSYAANNFDNKPTRNGAWLIKNSWGTGFGNQGYFWMSYDEYSLGSVYSYEFKNKDEENIYQYDGTNNALRYTLSSNTSTYANEFLVKRTNEELNAVSVGSATSNIPYKLEIYTNLTDINNPTSGNCEVNQNGIIENDGINYIKLSKGISLKDNTYYSIVFTLFGTNENNASIMLDATLKGTDIEFIADTSNEYCFIKSYNTWGKLSDNTFRIKGITIKEEPKPIETIILNKTDITLTKGTSETLQATINPSDTTDDKTLKWTSSNPDVATVDNTGKVTAVGGGTATITVKSQNGKEASCEVKVTSKIESISLNKSNITLSKGTSETLKATINPSDTTDDKTLKWTSSNPNIATVDNTGKVTAVGGGTATITVKSQNGKEASCEVKVTSKIESISLNKSNITLSKGTSETLKATINPSDATDAKTLTWKSEDENIAKVDGNGKVTGVGTGTTNITVTTSNGKSAACKVTVVRQTPSVNYSTHVQDIGWQGYVKDGSTAGTTGQSKRLEAIRIKLSNNTSYNGTIQYQTHIQDIGWQGWKMNDDTSGTSGQSKRLEAIRIKLTDELAENYDIYYRVHAQEFGWLGWAKNGESAGTAGYSYRLEAIEVKLVEKGGKAPGSTQDAYRQRYVSYQTHVQDIGWQGIKYDGEEAGTSGQSKRLEAINISLSNPLYSGSIEYQTHVQDIGWQGWKANGQMAGTSGQSKRLEAIRIKLTGEMAKQYDIYYRVHSQEFGWLGWAKNGESAGTEGYSYRLEAIQIQLVKKGSSAPGSTSNCFYKR
ncbi:Ig-like domain-containing protein [Faecalibacillus intestinalis]|uniref:Ig-like domain-containing protein n=1 Tax=Faecalibacillus intestinalis TaxID=1982626 RepID=UPI0035208A91